jgi:hypothetical protein
MLRSITLGLLMRLPNTLHTSAHDEAGGLTTMSRRAHNLP